MNGAAPATRFEHLGRPQPPSPAPTGAPPPNPMKISVKDSAGPLGAADLLVLFGFEEEKPEIPPDVHLAKSALADFKGKFRETRLCDATSGSAPRVLLIGLGKRADCDWERIRRVAALGVKRVESMGLASGAIHVGAHVIDAGCGADATGCAVAEAAVMGAYVFDRCKSKPTKRKLQRLLLVGPGREFASGVKRGEILGRANCFARDLQNAPGNMMTPTHLAEEARKVAGSSPAVTCRVLDEAAMGKLGMGALLGVARGSREPAKLIHLTYKPTRRAKNSRRIALVGKGLTFDTGGISLKPGARMDEMKFDMSGGAAVLEAMGAIAALDVAVRITAVVPSTENMPSGHSMKPGDIVTAMNGKTIEINNTDAEGRLILADALAYAVSEGAERLVDLATLTGAIVVALGSTFSGLFSNDDDWYGEVEAASNATGELGWRMPLHPEFLELTKGVYADLTNASDVRKASSSYAAEFLRQFVDGRPWVHVDIAGTAWDQRRAYNGSGASGFGVRMLVELAQRAAGG